MTSNLLLYGSIRSIVGLSRVRVIQRSMGTYRSLPLLAEQTISVPNLGDSITEGTIVEWTVKIGQQINEGDVIALIETDKVRIIIYP